MLTGPLSRAETPKLSWRQWRCGLSFVLNGAIDGPFIEQVGGRVRYEKLCRQLKNGGHKRYSSPSTVERIWRVSFFGWLRSRFLFIMLAEGAPVFPARGTRTKLRLWMWTALLRWDSFGHWFSLAQHPHLSLKLGKLLKKAEHKGLDCSKTFQSYDFKHTGVIRYGQKLSHLFVISSRFSHWLSFSPSVYLISADLCACWELTFLGPPGSRWSKHAFRMFTALLMNFLRR